MENSRVKAVTEAVIELYWQGDDKSVMMLRGALFGLYVAGRITKEETDWTEEMLQVQIRAAETGETDYGKNAELTKEVTDDTVLWLRKTAVEISESLAFIVYQAAEFLNDFWEGITD